MYISPLDFAMKQTLLDLISESSMPKDQKVTMNRFIKEEMTQEQAHTILYEIDFIDIPISQARLYIKQIRQYLNRAASHTVDVKIRQKFVDAYIRIERWLRHNPPQNWVRKPKQKGIAAGILMGITALSTAAYLIYYYALSRYVTKCQDQKGFDKQICIYKAKAVSEEETIKALRTSKNKCNKDNNPEQCRERHDKLIEKHDRRRKKMLNNAQKLFDRV